MRERRTVDLHLLAGDSETHLHALDAWWPRRCWCALARLDGHGGRYRYYQSPAGRRLVLQRMRRDWPTRDEWLVASCRAAESSEARARLEWDRLAVNL